MTLESILYFLPLLPALIYAWVKGNAAHKRILESSKSDSKIVARDLLTMFLKAKSMDDIQIAKGDNYLQNVYVESENRIDLSPDTIDSVDVASLALVLRAGAQAATVKQSPQTLQMLAKLRNIQTILFWTVFCILAFGIMTSSLVISIVGYVLLCGVLYCGHIQRKLKSDIDNIAIEFMRQTAILPQDKQAELEEVFAANRRVD